MKKWIMATVMMVFAALLLTACGTDQNSSTEGASANGEKLKVAVSFNAMKEFTQAVGKDKVDVIQLIPDGTEPHDFQPTTKSMKDLADAKVFVYQGLGMEPWADQVLTSLGKKDLTAVEAGKGVDVIQNTDPEEAKEHGPVDPHAFLSLSAAQVEVQNIADALAKADPANADYYQKNAADYKGQLKALQDEYTPKFAALSHKDFVTGHAAFAYLCRDFGLTQNSVEDVFADGEPSTQKLAELVDYSKAHQVKTIFVEDMVSPKTSETLAKEVGATTKTIHTMESGEGAATYLDRMKENLEEIYTSLAQ